jgi:hypothetical protein
MGVGAERLIMVTKKESRYIVAGPTRQRQPPVSSAHRRCRPCIGSLRPRKPLGSVGAPSALSPNCLLVYLAGGAAAGILSLQSLGKSPSSSSDCKFSAARISWRKIRVASAIREFIVDRRRYLALC